MRAARDRRRREEKAVVAAKMGRRDWGWAGSDTGDPWAWRRGSFCSRSAIEEEKSFVLIEVEVEIENGGREDA